MNIMQAYTKKNHQYVILISGFSGSGKSQLAKFYAKLFDFELMNLSDYHLSMEQYDKEENYVKLKDGTNVLDWDNVWKSIDWNKFNNHVIDKIEKREGLIISGFGFPAKLLKFKSDIHIHIKIGKQKLLENREKYKETHNKEEKNDRSILNEITYPHYLKLIDESKIDKYLNVNEITEEQTREQGFSYIIYYTNKWLTENDSQKKEIIHNDEKINNTLNESNGVYGVLMEGKGAEEYYNNVYFPDKHRKYYDFNDQGIDYPNEKKYQNIEPDSSSELDSSDSDALFIFTTK